MESDTLNNSPKTTLFIIEIVIGKCTLCTYIYNLLETDFANRVCMNDNHAYHVRLLENFHFKMINQAYDAGGL